MKPKISSIICVFTIFLLANVWFFYGSLERDFAVDILPPATFICVAIIGIYYTKFHMPEPLFVFWNYGFKVDCWYEGKPNVGNPFERRHKTIKILEIKKNYIRYFDWFTNGERTCCLDSMEITHYNWDKTKI